MDRRDFIIKSSIVGGGGLTAYMGYNSVSNSNTNASKLGRNEYEISVDNRPKIGSRKAPINIVYWVDFQCQFCLRFSENQFQKIKDNYIDSGKVSIVYKPVTSYGIDSKRAAHSLHCVNKTNANSTIDWYKELHKLYKNSEGTNSGWAKKQNLIENTDIKSINYDDLKTCINEEDYSNKINKDFREGENIGLKGTPFFAIYNKNKNDNYRTVTGVQPYNFFKNIIDDKL